MCGRFAQSQPAIHYAHALDPAWELSFDFQPTWNLAPSRQALIFRDEGSGHMADLLHWGFLPAWADPQGQKPINARVETAYNKPYFRKAWKSGRCLIPADGWYEWKQGEKAKVPYFLHRADDQPILMAGLYDHNPHANVTSFCILTTEADGSLREVHDRKPLVLSREAGEEWITPNLDPAEILEVAQSPQSAEWFDWNTVSTRVNNARNNGPELLEPV
jgi:putative SOS response-associated peptidase YedK